jgi:hypothetical protein
VEIWGIKFHSKIPDTVFTVKHDTIIMYKTIFKSNELKDVNQTKVISTNQSGGQTAGQITNK